MKKLYFLLVTVLVTSLSFGQDLIITGAYDGPLSGGTPKGVEIYVVNDIADLSTYGIGSANNGGGSDGVEFTFPADAVTAGTFLYVATESTQFTNFFGFAPNYTTGSMGINGDDAVELFSNVDTTPVVIDVFGTIDCDPNAGGTTCPEWEHTDGWAYRIDGTGPEGSTFTTLNWTYSGTNQLEGGATNAECTVPFPIGSYSTTASTTPTINLNGSVSLFYYEGNGPSGEETLSISGINLTNDITLSVPSDFEVSLTSGGPYASSVVITQTGGTVMPTDVYIRLVSGLTVNTYTGDATASSMGATDATLALTGTVAPADPLINTSGSISDLEYTVGNGPSTDDSFGVSALFLTDDLVITAPTNFQVSLTSGSGFANSITITPDMSGEVTSTDIFVRLNAGLAVGNYTGDVTVTSTGATDRTESVVGNVNPAAACSNVGDVIITEVMQNPSADTDPAGEYFELYNTTGSSIDLQGWVIKDDVSTGETHTIISSLVIPANGYIVIGNVSTTVPTLDYNYGNDISLGNSTDGIIIECGGGTIDQVIWDNGATFPDPSGASMELSVTALNATDNDDGANWGVATSDIGNGDLGTPGAVNDYSLSTNSFENTTFSIYPNPTNTGIVTITSSNSDVMNVQVFDILGKQVKNETLIHNTLNVSNLNTGVYILKITQNNATTTKKLVIK
ncbi:T9SS type A sorting domain-containing protein [Winogradskyella algicola]|uniref:T9SS type A sorting domain-containing protein n=1 Tax=Winogradskyella algicola TaxID=2575815 RepID=UPI001107A6E2|nr:lamin tail domain-containing protein [Winogradskyella algicola]